MLILTRKFKEKILIGKDTTVVVLEIGKGRVKLGIGAPLGTRIHRHEVWVQIQSNSTTTEPAAQAPATVKEAQDHETSIP